MKINGRSGSQRRFMTWLKPGMNVKRWLLLMTFGVVLFGLGVGYFLREVYDNITFPLFVYYMTLQFIPRIWRGLLFVGLSLGSIAIGVLGFNNSLLAAVRKGNEESLVDLVYQHR